MGITDQRIIFYDQGVLFKKKAMVSIPYNQVIGVASADEGIIFQTSQITLITAAGNFSFEFRGADRAHWAYRFILDQILNQTRPQAQGYTLPNDIRRPKVGRVVALLTAVSTVHRHGRRSRGMGLVRGHGPDIAST